MPPVADTAAADEGSETRGDPPAGTDAVPASAAAGPSGAEADGTGPRASASRGDAPPGDVLAASGRVPDPVYTPPACRSTGCLSAPWPMARCGSPSGRGISAAAISQRSTRSSIRTATTAMASLDHAAVDRFATARLAERFGEARSIVQMRCRLPVDPKIPATSEVLTIERAVDARSRRSAVERIVRHGNERPGRKHPRGRAGYDHPSGDYRAVIDVEKTDIDPCPADGAKHTAMRGYTAWGGCWHRPGCSCHLPRRLPRRMRRPGVCENSS